MMMLMVRGIANKVMMRMLMIVFMIVNKLLLMVVIICIVLLMMMYMPTVCDYGNDSSEDGCGVVLVT